MQDASLSDLYQRLTRLDEVLDGIYRDEKPYIEANDHEGWIYELLTRMHAGHLVSEDSRTFVTLPGEGAAEIAKKGVLRAHALHYALVEEEKHTKDMLAAHNIRNAKVLGADPAFRFAGEKPRKLYDCADAFILTRGDYVALREFVKLLMAKLDNNPDDATSLMDEKVLALRNSSGFWDPLISGLGLDAYRDTLREQANLHIASSTHDIDKILVDNLNGDADRKPKSPRKGMKIKPGAHDLMISGNMKKLHEWPEIYEVLKAQIDVRAFNNIVGLPEEAPEESHSYSGNCIEKLDNAAKLIDAIGQERVCEILREHGIDPNNVVIRAEDRGIYSLDNLFADPVFDDVRQHLNPYKAQPGAELAHVMEGMSIPDMYERLRIAAENKSEELRRNGETRDVDLSIRDYANTSLMPLLPNENGKRTVYSFAGVTLDTLTFQPRPASDSNRYSEHYLIPEHEPVQGGRTKAEIEGYIPEQSCMAQACHAMAHVTGMDKHKQRLMAQFRQAGQPRKIRIATQHSIMQATFGHGGVNGLQRALRPDHRDENGDVEFEFLHGKQGDYDITKPRDHTVPAKGGGHATFRSALNNMHALMRNADGFLLTPENAEENDKRYFWQRLYFSNSATVAKQTFDRTLANKIFAVYNPSGERNCRDFECVYQSLHRKGLIGEKPGHIYKAPKTKNKLVKKLREAAATYVPPHIPAYEYEESGEQKPEGMDRITVYASAKFNNDEMDAMARYVGYEAAANGFALKNGGGKDGLMLQTSLGFHEFRNNDHNDPRHDQVTQTHIASVQCAETKQMEGLCDFNDLIKVYPSIHLRIEDLADAETEIVLPGGAGTWQEIAGSAILRQAGLKPVANHPLIIVDPDIGHGRHRTKPYQHIIDMIPEDEFDNLNIHVVETGEQAMELAMQARDARRRAVTYDYCVAANDSKRDWRHKCWPQPA